jgi:hypothetical protein
MMAQRRNVFPYSTRIDAVVVAFSRQCYNFMLIVNVQFRLKPRLGARL